MTMRSFLLGSAATCCVVLLTACTTTGTLTPQAATDVKLALDTVCPLLADAQPTIDAAPKKVQDAAKLLALACPPNPAPTTLAAVENDIIPAYQIVVPYIQASLKK